MLRCYHRGIMKKYKQYGISAFLILGIVVLVVNGQTKHAAASISNAASTAVSSANAAQTSKTTTSTAKTAEASLVADMNTAANSTDLSWAASVIDLQTGKEYDAGATSTVYKAASTAKVLTAVDYLHEVEQGQATLDQSIDGTSARQLMQQMIEVSDNTAWSNLNDYLGDAQEQAYATSLGMTDFTGSDYQTMTAHDEAILLAQLADGKLINSSDRSILYNFMANTDSSNLIPAALPSGATVYHKYGELWGDLHDAAIVHYQGHSFVLVVYTNNTDGTMDEYNDQVSLIHDITAAVWKDISAS
jgi:beta-lactamase class A